LHFLLSYSLGTRLPCSDGIRTIALIHAVLRYAAKARAAARIGPLHLLRFAMLEKRSREAQLSP
jgi:hypothetical protein